MSRFMSAVWVIQICLLVAAAVVAVVRPSAVLSFLEECVIVEAECQCCGAPAESAGTDGGEPRPGGPCFTPRGLLPPEAGATPVGPRVDRPASAAAGEICAKPACAAGEVAHAHGHNACVIVQTDTEAHALAAMVRMLAPFLLAFALFAGHAAMREDERVRRSLSFAFAFIYTVLAIFLYTDNFSDEGLRHADFLPRALLAVLLALGLFAVHSVIRAQDWVQRALWALIFAGYALAALALGVLLSQPMEGPTGLTQAIAVFTLILFVIDTLLGDVERLSARLFSLLLVFPAVLAAMDALSETSSGAHLDEPLAIRVFLAFLVFCVFVHALYAMWPMEDAARRLSGSANTRPSSLWVLWLAQGVFYFGLAGTLVWAHGHHRYFFYTGTEDTPYQPLFADLNEVYPAFLAAIGLFSFTGMQASREWVWKAHCAIFAVFYASVILCGLFIWNGDLFYWWTLAAAIPALILLVAHVRFYRSQSGWFSEEVGEGPDGWILVDLVLGPLLLIKTLISRRRATHARGVAAHGTLRVLPGGDYPAHELFREGPDLPIQVRFGNERSDDDAGADARGAAIHISTPDRGSLDLLLGTGAYSGAENIVDFGIIAALSGLGSPGLRLLARSRQFFEGGIAGLRRAPASYTQLCYHMQAVRFWVAENNERYLVRYRLLPEEGSTESGLPVTREDFVDRRRLPGERRPTDYLRRELKMRLEGELAIQLRLQAQFHRIEPGDGLHWYNPGADWRVEDHPWKDLADLTLEDVLSDEAAERLCFNPDNAPSSLGTPVSAGLFDPRSIADSERRVMRRVQSVRQWLLSSFGLPSSTPRPVS